MVRGNPIFSDGGRRLTEDVVEVDPYLFFITGRYYVLCNMHMSQFIVIYVMLRRAY